MRAHHGRDGEFGSVDLEQVHAVWKSTDFERGRRRTADSKRVQRTGDEAAQRAQRGDGAREMRGAGRQLPSAARAALRTKARARSTAAAAMPVQTPLQARCATGIMVRAWIFS